MKHNFKITFILISIFLLSQIFGLYALNKDMTVNKNMTTGKIESVSYNDPIIGERPEMNSTEAFWYMISAIVIGTLILLIIIRFKKVKLWKAWFFLAVLMTVSTALGIFLPGIIAFGIALTLVIFKILKPNFYVQNISEILMYTGIAYLFVPLFKLKNGVIMGVLLLVIIAIYDAYAVWHSKHMVKMANFQTEAKLFAGLTVPYKPKENNKVDIKVTIPSGSDFNSVEKSEKIAILGGGDISFPLIFSGIVMQSLIMEFGVDKTLAFFETQIITVFAALALLLLFIYGKKDRFYPAMPFISAGCLIGYGIIMLIQLI